MPTFAQEGGYEIADVPNDLSGHEAALRRKPVTLTPIAPTTTPTPTSNSDFTLPNATSPTAETPKSSMDTPYWEWNRATGDWWGVRNTLEDHGFIFNASYIFEWSSVWSGGVNNLASTRSIFDANVLFDLDKAVGWTGGSVFVNYYSTDGRGGSDDVGDTQGFSNIATGRNLDQIAELWYQQVFFDGIARLKLGKIDANSEFDFLNSAGDFSNSSAGFSPTLVGFPSYPNPSTGGVLQIMPIERGYISVGFFDGATGVDGIQTGTRGPETFFSDNDSDDWYWIGEIGYGWDLTPKRDGRVAVGVWHHTGEFAKLDTLDPGTSDGTTGFYALAEQRVWSRSDQADDVNQGVYIFAQFAASDGDITANEFHAAVGTVLKGTFEGRDSDSTGIYATWLGFSDESGINDDETAIDAYYKTQLTPFASIKPGLQVIFNPGGNDTIDTAVVGSIRFEVVF